MRAFLIHTLGCKLNQLESESITDSFLKNGFELYNERKSEGEEQIESSAPPSVIVINTCTVTSKADQKARRVIRKALRDYPDSRIIVTGCYAQLNRGDILRLQTGGRQRLHVIDRENSVDLPRLLADGTNPDINQEPDSSQRSPDDARRILDTFSFNPEKFSRHTRVFLKIQDGCDKHCAYCRIRLARGQSISLDKEEALSRLRILEQTHAEAVLTGVNICQYKSPRTGRQYEPAKTDVFFAAREEDKSAFNLPRLLSYLLEGTSKIAIRLSSLAPDSINEELVSVLSHKRIRPHFHISVQSCSNLILEKMGRFYSADTVEKAVSLLRRAKNDPFLACDIITGFPGETEAEFYKTYNLCQKLDFAWIHVFPFSKRPDTPAFLFTDTVAEREVSKRVRLLTSLARHSKADYTRRWLGREVEVIIINNGQLINKNNQNIEPCYGVCENYLKVRVRRGDEERTAFSPSVKSDILYPPDNEIPAGTVIKCRLIEEADNDDFDAVASCLF